MEPDFCNGMFEFIGAYFTWRNALQLRHDKFVCGVYWPSWVFFSLWGAWNLFYYTALHQYFSFAGGIALVSGNVAWCYQYWRYRRLNRRARR